MITTKMIRRFKKRVFKYEAVLSIFFMIGLAAIAGFLIGRGMTEQSTLKEISSVVLGILFGAIISWDMVDSIIGEAIEFKLKEELRAAQKGYGINSRAVEVEEQQELEYISTVPQSLRKGADIYSLPNQSDGLEEYKQDYISREAAVRGLDILTQEAILQGLDVNNGDEEDSRIKHDPLGIMALSGAIKALRIDKNRLKFDSRECLEEHEDLTILRADIYIYLKAWLMKTIKFGRPMKVDRIRQRYPDSTAYIRALEHIRQSSIHSEGVARDIRKFIDDDFYVKKAVESLDHCISVLIEELKKVGDRTTG